MNLGEGGEHDSAHNILVEKERPIKIRKEDLKIMDIL